MPQKELIIASIEQQVKISTAYTSIYADTMLIIIFNHCIIFVSSINFNVYIYVKSIGTDNLVCSYL